MTRYADAQIIGIKKAMLAAGEAAHVPASTIFTRYAIERFMRRLGSVENNHKREVVLRGGVLLAAWHPDDARPSTSLDLICRRPLDDAALQSWLQTLCAVEDPDDGLVFQSDSILLSDRRAAGGYRSRRATLGVLLGRQRTQLTVDVAYQKDVLPHPQQESLPTVLALEMQQAKVWTCVRETVLAEKLHMVHALGRQPSYKDIYDMFLLTQLHSYVGGPVMAAIKSSFDQNISTIGEHLPHALAGGNCDDAILNAGWGAFLRQLGSPMYAKPWPATLSTLHDFFAPPWDHLQRQKPFASRWEPESGWR